MNRISIYFAFLLVLVVNSHVDILAQESDDEPSLWNRETATGDWAGMRTPFNNYGFNLELNLIGDVMSNISGGVEEKSVFIQNIDIQFGIDNEKLFGLQGSNVLISALQNNGKSISKYAGDLQGVSNIEAEKTIRLFELWIQQRLLSNRVSILGGLYDVNAEFDFMQSASLFIQSSQGLGSDFAASGLIGPPTFPSAGLGGRLKIVPDERIYLQAGLMDGTPNSLNSLKHADFTWNKEGGTLAVAEIGLFSFGKQRFIAQNQLTTRQARSHVGRGVNVEYSSKLAVGLWSYSKNYVLERYGTTLPTTVNDRNDKGIYILFDWKWNLNPNKEFQQLSLFGRIGFADSEVSHFKSYRGGGVTYKGLIPNDPNGLIGFSVAHVKGSKIFQDINGLANDYETVLEFTYLTKVIPWLNIQPDIQYVINPGTRMGSSNALIIGFRTDITL